MNRLPWIVVTCALLLSLIVAASIATSRPAPAHPPEIAGQPVPEQHYEIDFTRRYDLYCNLGQEEKVFRGCKILGFTGKKDEPEKGRSYSLTPRFFENWLVVELGDGRMAYLPQNCLKYFEIAPEKRD